LLTDWHFLQFFLQKAEWLIAQNLLAENWNYYRICLYKKMILGKICSQKGKIAYEKQICSEEKIVHWICLLQQRKITLNEKPCRLGWITTVAKMLASSESEHGWWCTQLAGLKLFPWNVLWLDPQCTTLSRGKRQGRQQRLL
jgi:hypothetical protein